MGPIRTVIRPSAGAATGEAAISSAFNLLPKRPRTPSSPYSLSNSHVAHTSTSTNSSTRDISSPYNLSNHHAPHISKSSSPFYNLQRAYTQATTMYHTHPRLSTRTLIPAISYQVDAKTSIQHGGYSTKNLEQLPGLHHFQNERNSSEENQGSQTHGLSSRLSTQPPTSLYQHVKVHLPPRPLSLDGVKRYREDGMPHQETNKQIKIQESNATCSSSKKAITKSNLLDYTHVKDPRVTTYPFNLSDDEESEELQGEHQNWEISDIVETDEEGTETQSSTLMSGRKVKFNLAETSNNPHMEQTQGLNKTGSLSDVTITKHVYMGSQKKEYDGKNISGQDDFSRKHNYSEANYTAISESKHRHTDFIGESTEYDSCNVSVKQPDQCNSFWSQAQPGKANGNVRSQPTSTMNIEKNDHECNTELDNESFELSDEEDNMQSDTESNPPEECDGDENIEDESEKTNPGSGPTADGTRATGRLRPRSYRQFLVTREHRSRVFLKARSHHLGRWFVTHFSHPYPSKDQKDRLAAKTNMNRNQVSEWFGNMRRRIREATRRLNLCWEERVRVYNTVITGKSEPLPILPDDAINSWVPPTVIDSSQTDSQEEATASHKFKRALLHRYLNDSYETTDKVGEDCQRKDYQDCKGNRVDSIPKTGQTSFKLNHSKLHELPSQTKPINPCKVNHSEVAQSQFENHEKSFYYIAPLCTSSPKENSVITWSNPMDNFNKNHNHISSQIPKDQAQQKAQTLYGYASKFLCKQKCPTNDSTEKVVGSKKSLLLSPFTNWLSQTSTSNGLSNYLLTSKKRPEEVPVAMRSSLPPPYHISHNNVEQKGSGVSNLVVHKPEELAAAYTLVELQQM